MLGKTRKGSFASEKKAGGLCRMLWLRLIFFVLYRKSADPAKRICLEQGCLARRNENQYRDTRREADCLCKAMVRR